MTDRISKKTLHFFKFFAISILFLFSLSFSGCKSTHTAENKQLDDQQMQLTEDANKTALVENNQPLQAEAIVVAQIEQTDTNPDVREGNVPPVGKNILMPYYVQDGDTLLKIAKKIYGDPIEWKKLVQINHIVNPNMIYAGDVFYYELNEKTKAFCEVYENASMAKIIVKERDSLSQISVVVFGKGKDWRVLWKENPQITDPDKLYAGDVVYFKPRSLQNKVGMKKAEEESQRVGAREKEEKGY